MEKALSPYERYQETREKFIVQRFQELSEAGSNRMAVYRKISDELTPPMSETNIRRVLVRRGIEMEPAKMGRKPKVLA